ncbi:MAG: ADP-ribosylglycohydrolase family protein [Candidatus Aminicenantes bacterium]|nr:MAG: ADP-ribosylglycohydrolase family protein [Candidatus Aminicenantes bacterium]
MLNRFKGCLFGLAIGDALGAPVEFLSMESIKEKYGESGIAEFDVWDGFKPGSYTDDTQLSLATAKGCIHAHFNLMRDGEARSQEFVYKSYEKWLENLKDPFLVRHPGYTCMNVLQSGERGAIGNPINDSVEASGLLRTASVGLSFPPGMAFREGADYAALTHGHPSAYFAAGFLSEIIAQIIEGKSLQDAVELSIEQLTAFDNHMDLLQCVEKALELFINQSPIEESIPKLGEGITAAEVLAIGVFCSLKHVFDFPEGIQAAVNHSGASTSCGLVTGGILGALIGYEAIPEAWSSNVENAEDIIEIAEDMYKVFKQGERISFEKYSLE